MRPHDLAGSAEKKVGAEPVMWNVLRHQIRNYVSNLRKQKDGPNGDVVLTIRKVPVQVSVQASLTGPTQIDWGYVVLNDITPNGMYVFSTQSYPKDRVVSLTLEEPRRFYARARVISSQNVRQDSHIISEKTYSYRVALEYEIQTEEERKTLREFSEEVQRVYLYKRRAA